MKIINTITNETVADITTNHSMSLDEAISLVGEIHAENEDENVLINGTWYFYDDLALVADEDADAFYWWVDTDFHYGDFSVPKFAVFRMRRDEDGVKYPDTEELVFWAAYDDVPGCDAESDDWEPVERYIEERLGFLPDYDIN